MICIYLVEKAAYLLLNRKWRVVSQGDHKRDLKEENSEGASDGIFEFELCLDCGQPRLKEITNNAWWSLKYWFSIHIHT
jgi:hypothetical protein